MAGVGSGLNVLGKEVAGPALSEVGMALDEFGRNVAGPALSGAGNTPSDLGKNHVGPALGEAGKSVEGFGKDVVRPALAEVGTALNKIGGGQLSPALVGAVITLERYRRRAFERASTVALGVVKSGYGEYVLKQLSVLLGDGWRVVDGLLESAGQWVQDNKLKAIFLVVSIVLVTNPEFVLALGLGPLGFTPVGPAAGKAPLT